jgi:hypothetical protein
VKAQFFVCDCPINGKKYLNVKTAYEGIGR